MVSITASINVVGGVGGVGGSQYMYMYPGVTLYVLYADKSDKKDPNGMD